MEAGRDGGREAKGVMGQSKGLECHDYELRAYPKGSGEPLKAFKQA